MVAARTISSNLCAIIWLIILSSLSPVRCQCSDCSPSSPSNQIYQRESHRALHHRPLRLSPDALLYLSGPYHDHPSALQTAAHPHTMATSPVTADFSSPPLKRSKIVLLGDQSVGKTSLITRHVLAYCAVKMPGNIYKRGLWLADSCTIRSTIPIRPPSASTS